MGRAFIFGDKIDTDALAPGNLMKLPAADLAKHCLEAVDPTFAGRVQAGDIVVAGRAFGIGSSREQAAISLKELGIAAILAKSFARIFYRNAINIGLPALFFPQADEISPGDELKIDFQEGIVENRTTGTKYSVAPLPPHLLELVRAGGLIRHLEQHMGSRQASILRS